MTAISLHVSTSHIRPLDVVRDLGAVAELLAEAFQGDLDAAGQRAVREMRRMGQWGGWLAWLDSQFFPDTGLGPGFVWVQDGRVVGHLSLRRATPYGSVWLIGNVAVRAAYRGRGIGRALVEEALQYIRRQAGSQASLLVRADNAPAMRLYGHLGFRQAGALAYWRRPFEERRPPAAPGLAPACDGVTLRPARAEDQRALYDLARAGRSDDLAWAEPVRYTDFDVGWERRLGHWVTRRRQVCLAAETGFSLVGASWADVPRPPDEGRLRVWTAPGYRGQLEATLIGAALAALEAPVASLTCDFPSHEIAMYTALAQFGFAPVKILAHMQIKLQG